MIWYVLVLLIVNKEFVLCDTPKPRDFPLCVTDELFTEYAADLPEGVRFKKFISEPATRQIKHIQSSCSTCGVGNVQKVWWGKIKTNFPPAEYATIEYLRQWIHVHVTTSVKVQGIIVQAVTGPSGMADGNFDVEFGCKDCGEDINLSDALQGNALGLGDKAAALPCRRRTYLHVRHPYVYAYASSKNSRSSFHMNYNFLDIPCRETLMIQLMIMTVPDFNQNSADYVFSGTIDHYQDSLDGMPYPYHVSMHNQMTCHEEHFAFDLVPPSNGLEHSIPYNGQYDSCTIASESVFNSLYKETKNYFSRYICKYPPRTRCEFPENTPMIDLLNSPAGCHQCSIKKNYYTVKAFYRVVPKIYSTRRWHGLLMIFGMVAAPGISIHIARYMKETRTGCFLVGWWLWVHLFLTFISKIAVWIGLAYSATSPHRTKGFGLRLDTIHRARGSLIDTHTIVGVLALVAFHISCIVGPFRCRSSTKIVVIYVHTLMGYVSVVLALIAVINSTTCFDNFLFTILMVAVQIGAWILAMALHLVMDRKNRITPTRKLLPVIEAVELPDKMPKIFIRLLILLVLIVGQLLLFFLMVFSAYKGFMKPNPCANCKWKYDEFILADNMTNPLQMHLVYNCSLDRAVWQDL